MSDWCKEKWVRVGMEVPFFGNTCFKWAEASVPAPPSSPNTDIRDSCSDSQPVAPSTTTDYATSFVIGTPPTYLILRIYKSRSHVLEILELEPGRELSSVGLRIIFPDAVSPFAYICENQNSAYLLYALSVSGIAYCLLLDHVCNYTSSYIFSSDEVFYFDTNITCKCPPITAVAATAGSLVVGRSNGSVSCFRFGECDVHAPDFVLEFDNKTTFFWRLISSQKYFGSVVDLVISEIHGRKVVFVLHSCGNLQVWDLQCQAKLLSQCLYELGYRMRRLYVGADIYSHKLRFAVVSTDIYGLTSKLEQIRMYSMNCPPRGRYSVLETSLSILTCFMVPKGKLVDLILTPDKLCYLTTDEFMEWILSEFCMTIPVPYYSLQEDSIEKQLFQNSEHSSDALYQAIYSMSSSSQAQIKEVTSSIFLQRLLHPGVYDISVFRSTFELYGKHWTKNEFEALTVDELRSEIQLLIQHQVNDGSPYSVFVCWNEFCSRYLDQWRKRNGPCCLIFDSSTQAMGVFRQNGSSLFRSLEDIELPYCEKFSFPQFGCADRDILSEVLCYIKELKQHVCPFISPIFYDSVINARRELEDIVPFILKTGCKSQPTTESHSVEPVTCVEKFKASSVTTLLSLSTKSGGWGEILNVVQKYLKLLTPKKLNSKMDSEIPMNANTCLIVEATSQVAESMFESTLNMLLFMVHLLDIGGQVHILPEYVSKIQNLISMIHEVVVEWVIVRFLSTTPSESPLKEESTCKGISWAQKLGSVDLSLALVVLLDAYDSPEVLNIHFPNPKGLFHLAEQFCTWVLWARSMETDPTLYQIVHSLLRHGQHNAVKILFTIADTHVRTKCSSIQCGDDEERTA